MSLVSKLSWIGLASAIVAFSLPTKAQVPLPQTPGFDEVLSSLLTPLEAQMYQQMGADRARQLGEQTCNALTSGQDATEYITTVAQQLVATGTTEAQAQLAGGLSAKVIVAGVTTMCPEQITKLQQLQIPAIP
ncbi:DUF732 domain-containing protein [Roseofilum casamattae]|uniref:DUF732 domain-containing protein n=1 Tax=Roseofilum casamattae BLCC-M143 TaxID=3022442 RepID=A0ABT7BYR7_9CYAN|nr:DUF732 domain-containing protein [Roseofilum casamattae]MDJ1184352.1 DUF732 domain-containing protein [Roseofilum casamattae BLCC-M143]